MATYNVMTAYGALNNNSNDDAPAINNAIAAANAAGGGEVPSGAGYRINSALTTPNSEVSLVGEGWEASKIRADFNGDTLVLANSESQHIGRLGFQPRRAKTGGREIVLNNCLSIYLDDLNILDDQANGFRPYQGIAMLANGAQYKYYLQRVQVNGCDREGGIIGAAGGGLVQGVWIDNCEFARNYDGFVLFNGGGILIEGSEFLQNRNHGLVTWISTGDELASLDVLQCYSDNNVGNGIALYGNGGSISGIHLNQVWGGSNGRRGVDMNSAPHDVAFSLCKFGNKGEQGALFDGTNIDVQNCQFPTNGASASNTYDGAVAAPVSCRATLSATASAVASRTSPTSRSMASRPSLAPTTRSSATSPPTT